TGFTIRIVTTVLSQLATVGYTSTTNICPGDSLFLAGAYQLTAGTYTDSLTTTNGCDSVILTTLAIWPAYQDTVFVELCEGGSITAGGAIQTTSGIYFDSLQTTSGCDSIIVTDLTVHPVYRDTVYAEICTGESITAGGGIQTTSGSYVDVYPTVANCDSTVVTILTVNPVYAETVQAEICPGDSLFLAGAYQTTAGNYVDTLTTVSGC
ncbi:MAG: hypothetical protein AAFR05_23200, partial [Bacteroidota bacterium]